LKKEEKKKVKVPDYHYHSYSSLNLTQLNHHIPSFHPLGLIIFEERREEEGGGA
jgi:hypothetical protein